MLAVGIIGIITSFTDILYIPEYWNPNFFFEPLPISSLGLHITLEDTLFGFFLAGVAASTYFFIEGGTMRKMPHKHKHFILAFVMFAILFFGLEKIFPQWTIYNHIFAFFVAAAAVIVQRPDLTRQILLSGLFVTIYYFGIFKLMDVLTGDFLKATSYNLENLSGHYFWGVPIEEILFPLGVGMFGSVIYEYMLNLKTVKLRVKSRGGYKFSSNIVH